MAATALVLPTLPVALQASWQATAGLRLPGRAGSALRSVRPVARMFTAVFRAAAFPVFARRDV
jgi:hypothetical protein